MIFSSDEEDEDTKPVLKVRTPNQCVILSDTEDEIIEIDTSTKAATLQEVKLEAEILNDQENKITGSDFIKKFGYVPVTNFYFRK